MREGYVRVKDIPETRALGIAGRLGRARGITIRTHHLATTCLGLKDPKFFKTVPCAWLENTCQCWPASDDRCEHCKDIP